MFSDVVLIRDSYELQGPATCEKATKHEIQSNVAFVASGLDLESPGSPRHQAPLINYLPNRQWH